MKAFSLTRSCAALRAVLALAACAAISCEQPQPTVDEAPMRRDYARFRDTVYPVLLRDCGFPACHGDGGRFFRVWGPGRSRLAGTTTTPDPFDMPTGAEMSASYALALSFIDAADPSASDLLRKPLAIEAGGAAHAGIDSFGRNVYRTQTDAGLVALMAWAYSAPQPR